MVIYDGESDFRERANIKPGQSLPEAPSHCVSILAKSTTAPCRQNEMRAFLSLHMHHIEKEVNEALGIWPNMEPSTRDLLSRGYQDSSAKPFVFWQSGIIAGTLEENHFFVHQRGEV